MSFNQTLSYGEKVKDYLRRGAKELPWFDVYPNLQVGADGIVCKG